MKILKEGFEKWSEKIIVAILTRSIINHHPSSLMWKATFWKTDLEWKGGTPTDVCSIPYSFAVLMVVYSVYIHLALGREILPFMRPSPLKTLIL